MNHIFVRILTNSPYIPFKLIRVFYSAQLLNCLPLTNHHARLGSNIHLTSSRRKTILRQELKITVDGSYGTVRLRLLSGLRGRGHGRVSE